MKICSSVDMLTWSAPLPPEAFDAEEFRSHVQAFSQGLPRNLEETVFPADPHPATDD